MSSAADIVLLSLLAEQPRHGYDLDRLIEQRGYRQWTSLAFSSVYYLLKRLSERGLLEPDQSSQGRRTVFRVTEAERRELRQAAGERVLAPAPPSAGVLPALNAYRRLDDPALAALLAQRAEAAGVTVRMPPLRFCTDNGAQIAAIGSELVAAGLPPSDWDISPDSGMELTTTYMPPRA